MRVGRIPDLTQSAILTLPSTVRAGQSCQVPLVPASAALAVPWPPLLLGARRLVSSGGGGARFVESGFIVNP